MRGGETRRWSAVWSVRAVARLLALLAFVFSSLVFPTVTHAEDPRHEGSETDAYGDGRVPANVAPGVGASGTGLPGIGRVALAAPRTFPHAAVAANVGYGFTEAQTGESGSHHRALGSLALAAQPLRFLAAALTFDGRVDTHPDDVRGSSSSTVGEPRLIVRGNEEVSRSLALGAQLSWWVPGAEAPSLRFDASVLDAKALVTFAPPNTGLALALNAGYRLDRSSNVLDARERLVLRRGDRISLRLSDADAVLLGVGASKRLGPSHTSLHRIEALGEITWDVLIGSKAPSAIQSPLLLGLGGRYHLKEEGDYVGSMSVEVRAEVLLSERAPSGPTDPMTPIDPRFGLVIGFRWAPALVVYAKADGHGGSGGKLGPDGLPLGGSDAGVVRGRVKTSDDAAIAAAHVTATPLAPPANSEAAKEVSVDTGADGSFTLRDVPPGRVRVVAKAAGFEDASAEVNVDTRAPTTIDLVMKRAIKPGQLRGLVRSFTGKGLTATIKVEPLGVETKTDTDGTFQIDVPPGSYEVVVSAAGHVGQRRPVTVEENGVTILNADLRQGKDPPKDGKDQ